MKTKELHIKSLLLVLLTAFAAGLWSCTSDEPDMSKDNDNNSDESVLYFSLRIKTADDEGMNTDNPDYVDGTDFEHAIDFSGKSTNVIIFFDEDWKLNGFTNLEFDVQSAQGTPVDGDANEVSMIGFVRPDYHEAYIMPKYGILILNATNALTADLNELMLVPSAGMDEVLNLLDKSESSHMAGRSGNYFTMTSSAYLVKEANVWRHNMVFEIDRSKVFETRTQAIMSPALVAYVERMASKFSLKVTGAVGGTGLNFLPDGGRAQVIVCNYVEGEPNYNNRNWSCTMSGWGINKYEPTMYYFRNIVGSTTNTSSYPYTYGDDINLIGFPFFNGWNRAIDRRCFWAVDPHYETGIYPAQYRPAVDNQLVDYYGKSGAASLGYLSYNELSTDFTCLYDENGLILYSTENTFPDTRLSGLWQHDLGASQVVIGAEIHINNVDEKRADYDLYRNRLGIFYPSTTDFATYFLTTFNNQLNSQSSMTYRYYDWDNPKNNEKMDMRSVAIKNSNYKLYYKNAPLTPQIMASLGKCALAAFIENGDGKVIPWVDGMYIARREIDPNTYEEFGEIQRLELTPNELKSLILDWVGPFDHFNKGHMVYSVPIRYKASADKVASNNYRPTIGDYGVVRNTWYQFELAGINSLGNPVDDMDQKIIPYQASLENSIMMEIKVLDWHIFSTDVRLRNNNY